MLDNVRLNAGVELDKRAKAYEHSNGVDYRQALEAVLRKDTTLARRYSWGADSVIEKKYDDRVGHDLTPAQKAMSALYNLPPGKIQTMASWQVDKLARRKLENVGGIPDPIAAYRRAVADVKKEFPSLARAAQDGYITGTDWNLLAMLIPAVSGEVERGNYSFDSTRCKCGRNKIACRAKKLAAQRKIHEDNLVEYRQCILDAAHHGDALDAIRCMY